MPSAKTVVSTAASVAASAMVIRSVARDLLPHEMQHYLLWSIRGFFRSFSPEVTIIIEEFDGLAGNQIYKAAELYLGNKISPNTEIYRVSLPVKESKMCITMGRNQEIVDIFQGLQFKWRQVTREVVESKELGQPTKLAEVRHFQLKFHKKHKGFVLNTYFPFILKEGYNVQESRKALKLHTLQHDPYRGYLSGSSCWSSINLRHPATFDTMAMDYDLKKAVMDDLNRFVSRKDYYAKVGKAWKRGYLLYGPPGTGKSSLVAAMANYLNFSIYDLGLSSIHHDAELRKVLLSTENYSILVVEDIDCSLDLNEGKDAETQPQSLNLPGRHAPKTNKVTLSGLLNFIDGLWSSCGDARIIVFTTNHKDKLDPALLRPGRMDMHIHMSYCTPCGFRKLASNYLGVTEHPLFSKIEELMASVSMTPAEVGEQLLKGDEPDTTLRGLVEFLQAKKRESLAEPAET
ncbi:hypothetical protein CRG98_043020 [Punica granatum]|nr:hypothetical protein CRG98_043020 [Punica granatum]